MVRPTKQTATTTPATTVAATPVETVVAAAKPRAPKKAAAAPAPVPVATQAPVVVEAAAEAAAHAGSGDDGWQDRTGELLLADQLDDGQAGAAAVDGQGRVDRAAEVARWRGDYRRPDQFGYLGVGRAEREAVEPAETEVGGLDELPGDRVALVGGVLDEVEEGDGGMVIPLAEIQTGEVELDAFHR